MEIFKKSCEEEMILSFLSGEWFSNRFGEDLKEVIKSLNFDKKLILEPNIFNRYENNCRKKILSKFRGYGENKGIFENFPKIKNYYVVKFSSSDLDKIKYINYDYWNELSNNTSSPIEAKKNIEKGIEIYNVSNKPFLQGREFLKNGGKFKECIFVTKDFKSFTILEGHSRITCYALYPNAFENVYAFVLECNEKDFKLWEKEINTLNF